MMIYTFLGQEYVGCDATDWTRLRTFVLARNPVRQCWHLADARTGAMLYTAASRSEVRRVAKTAAPITDEQHAMARQWAANATVLSQEGFFEKFVKFPER